MQTAQRELGDAKDTTQRLQRELAEATEGVQTAQRELGDAKDTIERLQQDHASSRQQQRQRLADSEATSQRTLEQLQDANARVADLTAQVRQMETSTEQRRLKQEDALAQLSAQRDELSAELHQARANVDCARAEVQRHTVLHTSEVEDLRAHVRQLESDASAAAAARDTLHRRLHEHEARSASSAAYSEQSRGRTPSSVGAASNVGDEERKTPESDRSAWAPSATSAAAAAAAAAVAGRRGVAPQAGAGFGSGAGVGHGDAFGLKLPTPATVTGASGGAPIQVWAVSPSAAATPGVVTVAPSKDVRGRSAELAQQLKVAQHTAAEASGRVREQAEQLEWWRNRDEANLVACGQLQVAHQAAQQDADQARRQLQAAERDAAELKAQCGDLSHRLGTLRLERDAAATAAADAKLVADTLQGQLQDVQSQLQTAQQQLGRMQSHREAAQHSSAESLSSLQTEVDRLETVAAALRRQLEDQRAEAAEQHRDMQAKLKAVTDKLRLERANCSAQEARVRHLEAQLERATSLAAAELKELRGRVTAHTVTSTAVVALQAELQSSRDQLAATRRELEACRSEMESARGNARAAAGTVGQLTQRLEVERKRCSAAQQEMVRAQQARATEEKSSSTLRRQLVETREALAHARQVGFSPPSIAPAPGPAPTPGSTRSAPMYMPPPAASGAAPVVINLPSELAPVFGASGSGAAASKLPLQQLHERLDAVERDAKRERRARKHAEQRLLAQYATDGRRRHRSHGHGCTVDGATWHHQQPGASATRESATDGVAFTTTATVTVDESEPAPSVVEITCNVLDGQGRSVASWSAPPLATTQHST